MIADSPLVAFVLTTDPEKARAFYAQNLGLRLVHEDGFALVFDATGTMLRVTTVDRFVPAGATVLGWRVKDVRAEVRRLAANGVSFERYPGLEQDEAGVWTAPDGTMVAWFKDPDDNILSVSQ